MKEIIEEALIKFGFNRIILEKEKEEVIKTFSIPKDQNILLISENEDCTLVITDFAIYFQLNSTNEAIREITSSIFKIPKGYKDKFEYAGVTKAKANLIDVARVAESPIQYECKYIQTIRIPANDTLATVDVIIGQVIGIHIADDYILPDGKIDICRIQPVARLGYFDFTVVNNSFEMAPPKVDDPENQRLVDKGLEGKV